MFIINLEYLNNKVSGKLFLQEEFKETVECKLSVNNPNHSDSLICGILLVQVFTLKGSSLPFMTHNESRKNFLELFASGIIKQNFLTLLYFGYQEP